MAIGCTEDIITCGGQVHNQLTESALLELLTSICKERAGDGRREYSEDWMEIIAILDKIKKKIGEV